jgi:asparagine synthase (glutamine-hydrolysing)
VPIRHLAAAFRERFTVAMSGEGADEVFGGYAGPTFCAWDYDRSRARPCAAVRAALERGYGRSVFRGRADHFLQVNGWLSAQRIAQLLGDSSTEDPVMEWYGQQLGPYAGCATQEAYLALHARINMEGLLNRLDSSTMAASVEGRVPFTDHALVEAVFGLPMEHKLGLLRTGEHDDLNSFEAIDAGLVASKRVLREAFADAIAPRILNRAKMSFPVPFADGFAGAWAEPYREQLAADGRLSGCFEGGQLRRLREAAVVDPMVAWPLLNLAWWMDAFGIDPPDVSH